MCGIVGVTGVPSPVPMLLDGLSRLEYRGYDSAGIAVDVGGSIWRRRRSGKLSVLTEAIADAPVGSLSGIGHTRWATHGAPTETNAHPHTDCTRRLAIVHNGIVENHAELRAKLEAGCHNIDSETDSELLAHLIEDRIASGLSLPHAVRDAMALVDGAYAVAVVSADEPGLIVAARHGSPLVVGRTSTAGLLASDVPALLPHTKEVYALDDGQVVTIRRGALDLFSPAGTTLRAEMHASTCEMGAIEKGSFSDYMLKEIHEQPEVIEATVGGVRSEGLDIASASRIVMVGCGTSLHAGLAARQAFETWARIPVECEIASEFRYRDLVLPDGAVVIGISQSGETVDTLFALRHARDFGARTVAVTNVAGSAIAREADDVVYTRAGPEIGVAATKTHVSQLVALQQLALTTAEARGTLPNDRLAELSAALRNLSAGVAEGLGRSTEVFSLAQRYTDTRDVFFLGRGPGHAVALEGALKLKEIAYVRAEAYAAGEMKHGPIALVESGSVVVGIVGTGVIRTKMLSNIAEMKARGAKVILVAADSDEEARDLADDILVATQAAPGAEVTAPVLDVVPLQLFAYAFAKARGFDVDKPRNLAKTVTVE